MKTEDFASLQPQLFTTEESPSKDALVEVIVPPLSAPYTYKIPNDCLKESLLGCRVSVPLGNRVSTGYVTSSEASPPTEKRFKIKAVSNTPIPEPCFTPEQLQFYKWIAEYYAAPLGVVLETAIPNPTPKKNAVIWKCNPNFDPAMLKNARKQQELYSILQKQSELGMEQSLLLKQLPNCRQAIRRLTEISAIFRIEQPENPSDYLEPPIPSDESTAIILNERQQNALQSILAPLNRGEFESFLLHGITGSGKTEVYIQAAQHALSLGGGVLVLVPEIALTPQLIDRFRRHIREPIALLHSSVSPRKRWLSWKALLNGQCRIALGARSAVFTPIPNLKLVIVDEEHDGSYKQGEGLRYHARDLAVVRASLENSVAILGSATPSIETYYNAASKKFHYLKLPERPFQTEKLRYEIVNLNKISKGDMPSRNISPLLYESIQEAL
ncbi:MAG: DEAD/DEAH box helicase family protein, partial [Bdellovibrionales bacterium]|nr:DEAD/DEAH box helicase family protein [Bdellovibrionales bacterium]